MPKEATSKPKEGQKAKIVILGAGVGGVGTALQLANEGYEVTLLERNGTILSGSSDATPGRAGLGFHYINASTGIPYQDSTTSLFDAYPSAMLSAGKPQHHYMRYGLYFINKSKAELADQCDAREQQQYQIAKEKLDAAKTELDARITENMTELKKLYDSETAPTHDIPADLKRRTPALENSANAILSSPSSEHLKNQAKIKRLTIYYKEKGATEATLAQLKKEWELDPAKLLFASKWALENQIDKSCEALEIERIKAFNNKDPAEKYASMFPKDAILETYNELKTHYTKTVAEKREKDREYTPPCGEPKDFMQLEDPKLYKHLVDEKKIAAIVKTREQLLNWPHLRRKLTDKVNKHPNITVQTQSTVTSIGYTSHSTGDKESLEKYTVNITNAGKKEAIRADMVVNATWENSAELNHTMCFPLAPDERTNRLKVILTVKLPEALTEMPSMFVCMGPHMMFSNMGDGTGKITYAPVTNIKASTALRVDDETKRLLRGGAYPGEKRDYIKKILKGASAYITPFGNLTSEHVEDVGFGIVQSSGTVNVFDPNSPVHQRQDLGVEKMECGLVTNNCRKLLHFITNAKAVSGMVQRDAKMIQDIKRLIDQLSTGRGKSIEKFFEITLSRYMYQAASKIKPGIDRPGYPGYDIDKQDDIDFHDQEIQEDIISTMEKTARLKTQLNESIRLLRLHPPEEDKLTNRTPETIQNNPTPLKSTENQVVRVLTAIELIVIVGALIKVGYHVATITVCLIAFTGIEHLKSHIQQTPKGKVMKLIEPVLGITAGLALFFSPRQIAATLNLITRTNDSTPTL